MKQKIKIAILGGGGRTGTFLVHKLIDQGYQLKLLLRTPEKFQVTSPLIEIIKGDAIDITAIRLLTQDCQAIISTIGQRQGEPLVAAQTTRNIIEAMAEWHIRRYLLIAGVNVDTPTDKKGPETKTATDWMKAHYPLIQEDRQKAYEMLSASNVDWTLVRVPFIEFTDIKKTVVADLEDCKGSKIGAGDIADFLIEQLSDATYIRKSPFIANT